MLESACVNISTPYSRTRKTATMKTDGDEASASVKDVEDLGGDASADYWPAGTAAGRQRQHTRLINASCNAFFLRRGLDPNLDRRPPFSGIGNEAVPKDVFQALSSVPGAISGRASEFTQL